MTFTNIFICVRERKVREREKKETMAETTVSFDEGEAPAELNFYGSSSQWDAGAAASSSSRGQPASYS